MNAAARERLGNPVIVLSQGALPDAIVDALRAEFGAVYLTDGRERAARIGEHAGTARALVTAGPPGVDAALISMLPELEAIVSLGDGCDAIDLDAAQQRGIGVSNTAPDELCASVADTAVALTLNALRRFSAAERYLRAQRGYQYTNSFMQTRDLTGARVGILGLGRIGMRIARRLGAFDCQLAYHNRRRLPASPYRYADTPTALASSVDVLIVATTGGPHTRQLVDRDVLSALGSNGYVVNVARGDVIDQDALIELCGSGALAGAGLDVFSGEPKLSAALAALDNVALTPHIGGGTDRTAVAMSSCLMANLRSYLTTGELITPVLPVRT
ncbi:2-hydroxyacid dehydrogenase [Mycobacterium sp.]|uniref:2-hydroxyacid dehydrogenase n=1 Tax=Mycobacterium sp. TaxID=1785 RepID=UPI003D0E12A5